MGRHRLAFALVASGNFSVSVSGSLGAFLAPIFSSPRSLHLLKNIFSLVGLKRISSLLEMFLFFPGALTKWKARGGEWMYPTQCAKGGLEGNLKPLQMPSREWMLSCFPDSPLQLVCQAFSTLYNDNVKDRRGN